MNKWKECILAFGETVQRIAMDAWLALQKAWAAWVAAIGALVNALWRDVRLLVTEGKQALVALGNKAKRLFQLWFC